MPKIDTIKTISELFTEWKVLSISLFPQATEISSLHHAVEEICEVWKEKDNIKKVEEYVDVFMCLLTAMEQAGISLNDEFRTSFQNKFAVNMQRKWGINADSSYNHVK